MTEYYFDQVWDLHFRWASGVMYEQVLDTPTAKLVFSYFDSEYFNFAVPNGNSPEDLDLELVNKEFLLRGKKPAVFLLDHQVKSGFEEHLLRDGYKFEGRDTWVGYNQNGNKLVEPKNEIVGVNPGNFTDYEKVLGKVFVDFAGNDRYLKMMKETITGQSLGKFPGLVSECYLIYDNEVPASGAAMFYSVGGNFAYLHDAGTLENYRGRGYQSDLVRYRVNRAISLGIDRIYSSVDHGGKSWANSIKCGLDQLHTGHLLVKI